MCFGCGGISCFPGIHVCKFVHTTSGCERPRAVSVDSVKGQRQPANLPTENSRPPIPTRCTIYCAPTRESWRQLISKIAHSPSWSDPRAFQLQEIFTHREHQSPLLVRMSTPADTRKRNVEACVLIPSSRRGGAWLLCGLNTIHVGHIIYLFRVIGHRLQLACP